MAGGTSGIGGRESFREREQHFWRGTLMTVMVRGLIGNAVAPLVTLAALALGVGPAWGQPAGGPGGDPLDLGLPTAPATAAALPPAEANAEANRRYVEAALSLKQVAATRDPAERFDAYGRLLIRLDELPRLYPSSDLAVRLVNGTDPLRAKIEGLLRQTVAEWNGGPSAANPNPAGGPMGGPAGGPNQPPPAVRDHAGFFSEATEALANQTLAAIRQQAGKDLVIETFAEIPADLRLTYHENEKTRFFAKWADRRAAESNVNGIYVLICRNPTYLDVHPREAGRSVVTAADRDRLRALLVDRLRAKANDAGLLEAVKFFRQLLGGKGG